MLARVVRYSKAGLDLLIERINTQIELILFYVQITQNQDTYNKYLTI